MLKTMKGSRFARVGVAGLAMSAVLGGMGAANALPSPAKGAMSDLAHLVGFERAKAHETTHPEAQLHTRTTEAEAHAAEPAAAEHATEPATEPAHPETGTEVHGANGANQGPGGGSKTSRDAQPEHQAVEHQATEVEHASEPAEVEHASEPAEHETATEVHGGKSANSGSDTGVHD